MEHIAQMFNGFMAMEQEKHTNVIEELKKTPTPHGKLVGCSYYAYSSEMTYNSNSILSISVRIENGEQIVRCESKPAFQSCTKSVCKPNHDVLAAVQELVERENLAAWSALKYKNPFQMCDYSSSSSIGLTFDDSSIGGSSIQSVSIDIAAACQFGGEDVIADFRDLLKAASEGAEILSLQTVDTRSGIGMMNMMGGTPQQNTMTPTEPKEPTPIPDGAWKCSCGAIVQSRFCPECGRMRTQDETNS